MDQAEGLRELVAEKQRIAPAAAAAAQSRLRVIAITSGKGGVGKTNLAINVAVVAARHGKRVLLIDGDLGLSNVELLYGLQARQHLGNVLDGSANLMSVLLEGPAGIRVLPAGSGVQELTQLTTAQRRNLLAALDEVEDLFDLVLIDSGAGIGENVLFFVGAAQEAILVVSPEPTSLTDAYAVIKVLSQRSIGHFNVVVNPAPNEATARALFLKLSTVTNRFLKAEVHYLGFVPHDTNLHRAVMAQKPIVELFPQSPASRAFMTIQHAIMTEKPPPFLDGGLKFLWQRLLRESMESGAEAAESTAGAQAPQEIHP